MHFGYSTDARHRAGHVSGKGIHDRNWRHAATSAHQFVNPACIIQSTQWQPAASALGRSLRMPILSEAEAGAKGATRGDILSRVPHAGGGNQACTKHLLDPTGLSLLPSLSFMLLCLGLPLPFSFKLICQHHNLSKAPWL